MKNARAPGSHSAIAVVGIAGRFPAAKNVSEFWDNLRRGIESVTTLTDEGLSAAGVDSSMLQDTKYVKKAAVLDNFDMFDAAFFGFSPTDAAIMDPVDGELQNWTKATWGNVE